MNSLKLIAIIGVGILFTSTAFAQNEIRGTFVGADPTNTEAQGGGEFFSPFNAATRWLDRSGNPGAFDNRFTISGGNSGSSTTGTGGYQAGSGDTDIVTTISGLTPGDSYLIDFIHTNTFGGTRLPYNVGFTPTDTVRVGDTNVFQAWLDELAFQTPTLRVWDQEVGTTTADGSGEIKVYINLIAQGAGDDEAFYGGNQGYNGVSFSPVETTLLGDVNLDGTVNFLDIGPFIAVLTAGGDQAEADIDENGIVNFLDISPFVVILGGS